jgi:hypothetical protein
VDAVKKDRCAEREEEPEIQILKPTSTMINTNRYGIRMNNVFFAPFR